MFVVEVGSVVTTILLLHTRHGFSLQSADHAVAVVHGAVRQLRRGHGRRAAARRRPTRCARRGRRLWPIACSDGGKVEEIASSKLRAGDVVLVIGGRIHSRAMAKSSKASRRWMSRRSPASPRR